MGDVHAFRSTLSEIRDADLVLHVLDVSSPRVDEERQVAVGVLKELGVDPDKILSVWNKSDLVGGRVSPFGTSISAKNSMNRGEKNRSIGATRASAGRRRGSRPSSRTRSCWW